MFWKFGKNSSSTTEEVRKKLPKPRSIVEKVGRYLITEMKQNPDQVWSLQSVTRPDEVDRKRVNFRVFDYASVSAAKVNVRDYHSLDAYPEHILWEGWYPKDDYHVYLTKNDDN